MRTMMTIALAALALAACKKNAPEPAAEGQPDAQAREASGDSTFTAEMPDTPEARAFAEKLVALEVTDLNPTGASEFEYTTMTFTPDGRWSADAMINLGAESAPCDEVGTWRIDEMDGTAATMVWTVSKTDCATRSIGDETRLEMSILPDGTYKIAFR